MPKSVNGRQATEITSGVGFSFSSNDGQPAATQNRVFKVILNSPEETFDIQQTCNVRVGDVHPVAPELRCVNYDAKYEGDSRLVLICTFQYEAKSSIQNAQEDPKQYSPDIRPANWSISSSLIEVPAQSWFPLGAAPGFGFQPTVNPAGDIYDGVTCFEPLITISVDQWEEEDPTKHAEHVGKINSTVMYIGSLYCSYHTLMLRGIQTRPAVEQWGTKLYRGWRATYEFAYRQNRVKISEWPGDGVKSIGWNKAIPLTGFNVKAFTPPGDAEDDPFGQPLKHADGKIGFEEGLPVLPIGINDGDKVRAMVKVFSYEDGGVSQLPSAQPIPLNKNGRPRKITADPPVLVYEYRVYEEMDFSQLKLRLY